MDNLRMRPTKLPQRAAKAGAWTTALWLATVAMRAQTHWAFTPVQRPTLPVVAGLTSHHPIDAFIAEKLAAKGLALAPKADRRTLIRRLYFVMLGMPPENAAVAAFVADRDPRAFEQLVDRVLADPRYGERWGRHWLDVVRFAETNGFETNRERPFAWQYRDWVITAFNDDLPYDQFVREQIVGDALGAETATEFLVGGAFDIVGSPDPALTAQQRADQLDDMTSTTSTTFLGLTLGCARCHSHKFDPIPQRDYYAMTALFAGVSHGERALPPTPAQRAAVLDIDARIAAIEPQLTRFRTVKSELLASHAHRTAVTYAHNEEVLQPVLARFVRFTIAQTTNAEPGIDELAIFANDRNVALATNGAKATVSSTLPGYAIHQCEHLNDGRTGNDHSWISNEDGKGVVQIEFAKPERIDRIVWARDQDGKVRDRLATDYWFDAALAPGEWQRIASSDDREPMREASVGPIYNLAAASPADAALANTLLLQLTELRKQRASTTSVVMVHAATFSQPGPTYLSNRGDPMQPREQVAPAMLSLFAPMTIAENAPEQDRRKALAAWITRKDHPLTARVLVNRLWQYQFGQGLVSTPNDFGKNGVPPSHPELLELLASEFTASGYHIKTLQRLILTSDTWQQSSAPHALALQVDMACRLLWRFPPRRLEAEAIRDSILCVSGNLDRTMFGPSFFLHDVDRENVYHYHQKETFGPAESRRMIYAMKVRMEQDAVFGAFDCPDGSLAMPKRGMSTTPLQALNLFNSPFLVQQAGILSQRLQSDAGPELPDQLQNAWARIYQRAPAADELAAAQTFAQHYGMAALCRALLNANEFLFVP